MLEVVWRMGVCGAWESVRDVGECEGCGRVCGGWGM